MDTIAITIEEALAELREMFPSRSIVVSAYLCPNDYSIAIAVTDEYELFNYPTLSECMAQVRMWKNGITEEDIAETRFPTSFQDSER